MGPWGPQLGKDSALSLRNWREAWSLVCACVCMCARVSKRGHHAISLQEWSSLLVLQLRWLCWACPKQLLPESFPLLFSLQDLCLNERERKTNKQQHREPHDYCLSAVLKGSMFVPLPQGCPSPLWAQAGSLGGSGWGPGQGAGQDSCSGLRWLDLDAGPLHSALPRWVVQGQCEGQ